MFGERDNHARADAAAVALDAYTKTNSGRYDEESLETRVSDLIGDLLHLVRRDGEENEDSAERDPINLLDRARMNFEAEEEEEDGDDEEDDEDEEEPEAKPDPDYAATAARHFMDYGDDPGHGAGSACIHCLHHIQHG